MFIKKSKRIDQIFVPAEIPPNPRKKTHQGVAMTRWWSVEAAKVWLVVGGGGWWSRGGGREVVVEGTWKLRKPPTSRRDSLVVVAGRWRLRKPPTSRRDSLVEVVVERWWLVVEERWLVVGV